MGILVGHNGSADSDCGKGKLVEKATKLVAEVTAPVSSPRKTWQGTICVDMHLLRTDSRDIQDRVKRRT